MANFKLTRAAAAASFICFAASAQADSQAIAPGAVLTPTQIAHLFDAACIATLPALMEDKAQTAMDVFGFEAVDLGTDAGWIGVNDAITVTVDGNPLKAVCAMSIRTDLAGDGAELYESLEAHLSDHLDGTLPEADYIDGGVVWGWDGSNASFTLEYYEAGDAFGIELTSEG